MFFLFHCFCVFLFSCYSESMKLPAFLAIFRRHYFFKDKFILISLVLSLSLNLLIWVLLYLKIPRNMESVILHYNIYFSIDLIGEWYRVFILPTAGLVILFINSFLSYIIYKQSRLAAYLLAGSILALHFFLLTASLAIIFINL